MNGEIYFQLMVIILLLEMSVYIGVLLIRISSLYVIQKEISGWTEKNQLKTITCSAYLAPAIYDNYLEEEGDLR